VVESRLTVLQSFPEPRATTNPYLHMLRAALAATDGVEVLTFSWRRALTARYDVLHVHWPEVLLRASSRPKVARRLVLAALLALRLHLRRTPVVRTLHNVAPHTPVSRVEGWVLAALLRRTAAVVRLNDETPVPPGTPAVTVLHGHYRDWFATHDHHPAEPGRAAFVGLIRPYKNVEGLVRAFAGTSEELPQARLEVAGNPADAALGEAIAAAAATDDRVETDLRFLDDAALVAAVTRAQLVVLPYREMHNSGVALMALSLDRPVLLPDNEVSRQLAAEVGEEWVHRHTGELTAQVLAAALAGTLPPGRPDLSAREWDRAGADHLTAYRLATDARRRR
jgi:beta-1,4-mannosyltransferase